MRDADLQSALRLECRKHVAGPIEESVIRYEILGRSVRQGSVSLDLLVINFTLGPVGIHVSLLSLVGVLLAYLIARSLF